MTTCIATVEPRAKVAHTALLHECARYFADDRCWCTIGPRTLGASLSVAVGAVMAAVDNSRTGRGRIRLVNSSRVS